MNTVANTKQSWLKTIFQRISVIFGPKRLALEAGATNISENTTTIPEDFSFENIVKIYKTYKIAPNKTIFQIETLDEISDDIILKKLEFANVWRKCASGNMADEVDEIALPICFSDEAKETYTKITKLAITHLLKYGYIDTKEILDITKDMPYKWSRQTARKLFKNPSQIQILINFYRLATPNAKKQTSKTLTTDEALYGFDN